MSLRSNNHVIIRYVALFVAILILALIGYTAYGLYPRFSLPTSAASGLPLAIMAGLACLFSPCSFPLLVTLLAREVNGQPRHALYRAAAAFTMGVILFLLLIGVALGLGAGTFISQFTFTSSAGRGLRLVVGGILIGIGWWQLRGQSLSFFWLNRLLQPLWQVQTRLRRQTTPASYGLYGFGYILAGFG